MSCTEGFHVPVGPDAQRWVTRRSRRTALMIVHTVTSGQRLMDVAHLLAADLRIQVVFTNGPDVFGNGVAELLGRLGGAVLPWHIAVRHNFDLAISAAYGGIERIHSPLVVLPHGAGYNKRVSRRLGGGAVACRGTYGLSAQELVRDGMVLPAAIVLTHEAELKRLARSCPEAIPVAEVIGDPVYDRLVASAAERPAYRRALGVDDDRELVVVASTWGQRSLFGRQAELLRWVLAELPKERYRVAALLHPNIWFGHGVWQVRGWLTESVRDGLALVPPEAEWLGALVAADHVVGDHGSVTVYGAAAGAPVLLVDGTEDDVDPDSAGGLLAATAPRLRFDRPLAAQLGEVAASHHSQRYADVTARVTSAPGRFDRNMRKLLYRLMRLPQPPSIPRAEPVPVPFLTHTD
ncbi:hypothetical protein C1I98_29310 [Spongiactinospora gelatinilytica]|uniref:Uncharacterized protein n=2 Tax=Spongiactinospora gelatinilytica TaxID=2666298 RepID=A0A2W2G664_9ACTN|nr:hypothetical protein C1I98_29310 [Spongiactinospora gelatinilytica]